MRKLKDMKISWISLVTKGAIGRKAVFKSEGLELVKSAELSKSDDSLQMMYAIAYPVNDEDSQGDIASAEEVRKAMEYYMLNRYQLNVDREHNLNKETDVFVSENWIVKRGKDENGVILKDPIFPEDENVDAWGVGIKFDDVKLYKEAKNSGAEISIYGKAHSVDEDTPEKKTKSLIRKILEEFGISKPEVTENYIRIPVGPECKITATIDISKKEGIRALYCGGEKIIRTYLFAKNKGWTMSKAKEWIKGHKQKKIKKEVLEMELTKEELTKIVTDTVSKTLDEREKVSKAKAEAEQLKADNVELKKSVKQLVTDFEAITDVIAKSKAGATLDADDEDDETIMKDASGKVIKGADGKPMKKKSYA